MTYHNKDYAGCDICNVPGLTVEKMLSICKCIPLAVGFNSNGWIKYHIDDTNLVDAPGHTLYIIKNDKNKIASKNIYYEFFLHNLAYNLTVNDVSTFKSWECFGPKGLSIYVPQSLSEAQYQITLNDALKRFTLKDLQDPRPNHHTKNNGTESVITRNAGNFAKAGIQLNYDHIFEVGAGYGALANVILNSGFMGSYTIYDFEMMEAVDRWYIQKPFNFVFDPAKIQYRSNTLLISTWGISEMPSDLAVGILEKVKPAGYYIIAQNEFDYRSNIEFFSKLTGLTPKRYDEKSSMFISMKEQ